VNRSLLLIGGALLTWGIGEGMFLLFVPLYLQELGADPLAIGSILGLFGLMMMIVHIPAGYLADRFGRKPLLVISWGIGVGAAWLMAVSRTLPLFVIGYLVYGLTAFVSSPLFSYVAAARGSLSVGRAMTITSALFNAGAVAGPISGGWIGDHLGLRSTFLVAACVLLVSMATILFLSPQPRDDHDEVSRQGHLRSNLPYVRLLGALFVASFAMYLPQPLTPNFLQNERQISLEFMGWIGSAGSVGNVAFNLVLGRGSPRLGFLLGQAAVGFFAVLIWKGAGIASYALGYFLLGGFRAARVLGFAQVRSLVHQAQMGLAFGVTESVNAFAMILAPLAAGSLYARDPASIYPIALLCLAAAVLLYRSWSPRDAPAGSALSHSMSGERAADAGENGA